MSLTTNSDSEDDHDYVPPADDHDSDSADDQEEDTAETAPPEIDSTEQKRQRDALWASFQASVSAPPAHTHPPTSTGKRVKVEKTYLFAGKHVREIVEVPEESEEATKWPRWSPHPSPSTDAQKNEDSTALPLVADPSLPASTSTPGSKRPGSRKPRTVLPSIPKGSQAKKITTLDKSAMDWRTHVTSQSDHVQDELDANRRGGGYLEKVDFLKRVQERRDDAFEASKLSKRRKT